MLRPIGVFDGIVEIQENLFNGKDTERLSYARGSFSEGQIDTRKITQRKTDTKSNSKA
jgi:hypothetical protein